MAESGDIDRDANEGTERSTRAEKDGVSLAPKRRSVLQSIAVLGGGGSALGAATAQQGGGGGDDDEEFVSLFDGESIEDSYWHQVSGQADYFVEDGAIVGSSSSSGPNSFLHHYKVFDDFELRMEVKLDPEGLNSGIQVRSNMNEQKPELHGPQVEIELSGDNRQIGAPEAGYVYGEKLGTGWLSQDRSIQDAFDDDAWNDFRIRVEGDQMRTWINGQPVEDDLDLGEYSDVDHLAPWGALSLQVHSIGADGRTVRWRNIRINELDTDEWTSLFNGQNTDGWTVPADGGDVTVSDGALQLSGGESFSVRSDETYDDFVFETWVKTDVRGGLLFRNDDEDGAGGYRVDIDPTGDTVSGSLYDADGETYLRDASGYDSAEMAFHPDQWNYLRVKAQGDDIRVWVNGITTVGGPSEEFTDDSHSSGHLGLQHLGGDGTIEFRDMQLTPLREPVWYTKTTLDDGMNNLMDLSATDDGRLFYITRGAQFRGPVNGTAEIGVIDTETSESTVALELDVFSGSGLEDGGQGITVDPNFDENGYVYVYYSPSNEEVAENDEVLEYLNQAGQDGDAVAQPPSESLGAPYNRLSRFTVDGDTIDPESETELLRVPVQRDMCCHVGGDVYFGPEGDLYLTTGDNTYSRASTDNGYAPLDEREDREYFDAQRTSANTADLRGKILRITPQDDGSYTVPDGNLRQWWESRTGQSYSDEQILPEIYVMGVRNPFQGSVDPETGALFWGDYSADAGGWSDTRGPPGFNEFNRATEAGNYGWPLFTGPYPFYDYDYETGTQGDLFDKDAPINDSPHSEGLEQLPPARDPLIWYPGGWSQALSDVPSDYDVPEQPPFPSIEGGAPIGGPVFRHRDEFTDQGIPEFHDGDLFIAEWGQGWLKTVSFEGGVAESPIAEISPFAADLQFDAPIAMDVGPEGMLYVAEYGGRYGAADSQVSRVERHSGQRSVSVPFGYDGGGGEIDGTVTVDGIEYVDSSPGVTVSGGELTTYAADSPDPVEGTESDALYQSEEVAREDGSALSYDVTVENGIYDLTLHFAEIYYKESGSGPGTLDDAEGTRVLDVSVGGQPVIEGLDIFAEVGHDAALTRTIENVQVTDGTLTFSVTATSGDSKISGFDIQAADGDNLALNQPVEASSIEEGEPTTRAPEMAVDGDMETRWGSRYDAPEWIRVDLGSEASIDQVILEWEAAYATEYEIQVSNDDSTWTTVHTESDGDGGRDEISFESEPTTARYVRVYGMTRALPEYGFSLYEFVVIGSDETDDGDNDAIEPGTTIELGGSRFGWEGRAPSSIEGETNPTLALEAGAEYTVTWENVDNNLHDFHVVDTVNGSEDSEIEGTGAPPEGFVSTEGETASVTFTVTEEMVEYYCSVHPGSMRGTVDIVEDDDDGGDGPPAIGDSDSPPTDPNGDGLYEDVNGDGEVTYADVVDLFENFDSAVVQDNPEAFDFNGNGRLDYDDIIALFRSM